MSRVVAALLAVSMAAGCSSTRGAAARTLPADRDAETEAAAADLVERGRGLRHGHRMPRVDRDDAVAEAHARGGRGVGGEQHERVAAEAVGDPDAVVAQPVGGARELDGRAEVGAGVQVRGERYRLTSIASSSNSYSRLA